MTQYRIAHDKFIYWLKSRIIQEHSRADTTAYIYIYIYIYIYQEAEHFSARLADSEKSKAERREQSQKDKLRLRGALAIAKKLWDDRDTLKE